MEAQMHHGQLTTKKIEHNHKQNNQAKIYRMSQNL